MVLKFDGKNSQKDIANLTKDEFKKAEILPTIEKDGKVVDVIKDEKKQVEYFEKLVADVSKSLSSNYFFEKI
ncbi:hypothetical protein [Campylobacter hyointestinalis]|nr:hypothetical protein [Campylobacter hyointestinalis]CUU78964.1 methyltransferase [Campylobacter hyointestinalis subsp. hyointestinalis]